MVFFFFSLEEEDVFESEAETGALVAAATEGGAAPDGAAAEGEISDDATTIAGLADVKRCADLSSIEELLGF